MTNLNTLPALVELNNMKDGDEIQIETVESEIEINKSYVCGYTVNVFKNVYFGTYKEDINLISSNEYNNAKDVLTHIEKYV